MTMRGTSPGPCSYSPAMKELLAPSRAPESHADPAVADEGRGRSSGVVGGEGSWSQAVKRAMDPGRRAG